MVVLVIWIFLLDCGVQTAADAGREEEESIGYASELHSRPDREVF